MLLAIDVRNTHTVVGLISGSGDHAKVVQHWRIRTEPEVTSDELALTIEGLIGEDSERLTGATGLSTVPSVMADNKQIDLGSDPAFVPDDAAELLNPRIVAR